MEVGKVYRLHSGFTGTITVLEDGWLWLCISPPARNNLARVKSIATGLELDWPPRYFVHHTEAADEAG